MNINKKKITPLILIFIFFLMLGLSFAAVPLYDLFCRVQDLEVLLKMHQIKKSQKYSKSGL